MTPKIYNLLDRIIEPGDMVLTTPTKKQVEHMPFFKRLGYSFAFFFIRLVSRTKFVHVVMANGNNKFFSTEPPRAKGIDLHDFENSEIVIRRRIRPWLDTQVVRMRKVWKKFYLGKKYDVPQLVGMLISWIFCIKRSKPPIDINKHRFVCSTTQAGLERATGVNTYGHINTNRVTPGDCLRNKKYRTILKLKKGKIKFINP